MDQLEPEEALTADDEFDIDAVLHRLRAEAVRSRSVLEATDSPRWRLLIGLTCGHRYWLRRDRWRYPAALPHLYCPQCDVLQPVTVASRRKVRARMGLPAADLRRKYDQPPKPGRLGREPRADEAFRVLEVASRGLDPLPRVEPMKMPRGMQVDLVCGHSVRVSANRVRLVVDPGELECPSGDGPQRVADSSRQKAKERLGI